LKFFHGLVRNASSRTLPANGIFQIQTKTMNKTNHQETILEIHKAVKRTNGTDKNQLMEATIIFIFSSFVKVYFTILCYLLFNIAENTLKVKPDFFCFSLHPITPNIWFRRKKTASTFVY